MEQLSSSEADKRMSAIFSSKEQTEVAGYLVVSDLLTRRMLDLISTKNIWSVVLK